MSKRVKFVTPEGNLFSEVVRSRVDAYFETTGLDRHCNLAMVVKTIVCLTIYWGSYAAILSNRFTPWQMLFWCVLLGLGAASIGLNIAHDASHGGYSKRPWVNRLLAHTFTMLGVHEFYWNISHNQIHHSYTNIPNADADLHPPPILRYFESEGTLRWYHRYQHIYSLALYSLGSIQWVLQKDYNHVINGVHDSYPRPKVPRKEYFILAAGKVFHYVMLIVVPLLYVHAAVWQILLGFVVMHLATGETMAMVFALGHMVEGAETPRPDENGQIKDSWHAHQLRTTADFATDNRFVNWALGGLNFQIEHHLFPRICHVHYKNLAPIVRATAREFGLPYIEFPTFIQAVGARSRYLKKLGMAATADGGVQSAASAQNGNVERPAYRSAAS